jgi:hypothetical protein
MQVITSSRLTGRAPKGLAAALVEAETKPIEVEHPFDAIYHYQGQAVLRRLFDHPSSTPDMLMEIGPLVTFA